MSGFLPHAAAAALKTDPKDGGQIDFMISRKVKSTWRKGERERRRKRIGERAGPRKKKGSKR